MAPRNESIKVEEDSPAKEEMERNNLARNWANTMDERASFAKTLKYSHREPPLML